MLQVAVIGAGAAGLCAARHLAANSNRTVPTVFEQSNRIGGTWVYTAQTGKDARGEPIHSSMYKDLHTNLPKEVMAFPDFPFKNYEESFIHHTKVLAYLEEYCQHFDLRKFIKFNTKVCTVSPSKENDGEAWNIEYTDQDTNEVFQGKFDAVLVCNGHYSEPKYPEIKGIEQFEGKVVHSHDFRQSEDYRDEVVIVLGAAASGTDIAVQIASHVNQVYLAHNNPLLPSKFPPNVAQVRGIESCISSNGFLLTDGSRVQCDSLILATGYHYTFPFLSEECGIFVENNQVQPLYKHFINIQNPTMALIGMPLAICPFPLFNNQIRYFVNIILGKAQIPSKDDMYKDSKEEREYRINSLGMRPKDFHKMGDLQWEYNAEICRLGNLDPLPPVIEKLYKEVWGRRKNDLVSYKCDKFYIQDDQTFVERTA